MRSGTRRKGRGGSSLTAGSTTGALPFFLRPFADRVSRWELTSAYGDAGVDGDGKAAHGPFGQWVNELMAEKNILALPRTPHQLGRAISSSEARSFFHSVMCLKLTLCTVLVYLRCAVGSETHVKCSCARRSLPAMGQSELNGPLSRTDRGRPPETRFSRLPSVYNSVLHSLIALPVLLGRKESGPGRDLTIFSICLRLRHAHAGRWALDGFERAARR